MRLSSFWSGLDWDNWTYNLVKGLIAGGATSVNAAFGALLTDPKDFAFGSSKSFHLIGWTFAFGAVMSTFAFLSKSALPETKKREETLQVKQIDGKAVETVKTVKETSIVDKSDKANELP